MIDLEQRFGINKPSILYVDDERDNLTTFKSVFRRHYDLTIASSGAEGLEILKSKKIDLIITDQRMPKMTGIEFLKKTIPDYPEAIRMILTGFGDVKDIIETINEGKVYAYVTKPWHKEELKVMIDNAFKLIDEKRSKDVEIATLKAKIVELENEITQLKNGVHH